MNKRKKIIIFTFSGLFILLMIGIAIYGIMTSGSQKQTTAEKRIVQLLPYETDEFQIEHTGDVPGGTYTISLYAILNSDSQLAQYNKDLKQYKNDALSWLTDNSVDYKKININWLPEEASKI